MSCSTSIDYHGVRLRPLFGVFSFCGFVQPIILGVFELKGFSIFSYTIIGYNAYPLSKLNLAYSLREERLVFFHCDLIKKVGHKHKQIRLSITVDFTLVIPSMPGVTAPPILGYNEEPFIFDRPRFILKETCMVFSRKTIPFTALILVLILSACGPKTPVPTFHPSTGRITDRRCQHPPRAGERTQTFALALNPRRCTSTAELHAPNGACSRQCTWTHRPGRLHRSARHPQPGSIDRER